MNYVKYKYKILKTVTNNVHITYARGLLY